MGKRFNVRFAMPLSAFTEMIVTNHNIRIHLWHFEPGEITQWIHDDDDDQDIILKMIIGDVDT